MENEQSKQVILRERAQHLSQPLRRKTEKTVKFIVFSVGNEFYGFEVKYAREVLKAERITVVPCTPDFVEGVVNLRGNIISVLGLAKILNIEDLTNVAERWIIVVEIGHVEAALHVDTVMGVFDVSESSIEPLLLTLSQRLREHPKQEAVEREGGPEEGGRESKKYLKGEIHINDYLAGILDLANILVAEE